MTTAARARRPGVAVLAGLALAAVGLTASGASAKRWDGGRVGLWPGWRAAIAAAPVPSMPTHRRRAQAPAGVAPAALAAAVDRLGDRDFQARAEAARVIRRAAPEAARPLLRQAASAHRDGFVAFRSLVLLTAFGDAALDDLMVSLLTNPNDRLRRVAYQHFEHHPRPPHLAPLLAAAGRETAPFVRPSLLRALAAHGEAPGAREALARDLERGDGLARAAVVEAAGDYRLRDLADLVAAHAVPGDPLLDGAVLALGRIGDPRAAAWFTSLQQAAGPESQPVVAAGFCLAGVNAGAHLEFLARTLRYAATTPGHQALLRAAAAALGAVAESGSEPALDALVEVGGTARDPSRAPIALAIGRVAFRNPTALLAALERRTDLDQGARLVAEAFDMLEEDYEKERFGSLLRRAYWEAAERSGPRVVAETLLRVLEL